MSAIGTKRTLCSQSDFCRYGGKHVVGRQGSTDAFEFKFANRFDAYCTLDRHQDPRTNEDLPRLGFVAKPRCNIGYRSDGGVIETSLKADGAERGKSVRNRQCQNRFRVPADATSQSTFR